MRNDYYDYGKSNILIAKMICSLKICLRKLLWLAIFIYSYKYYTVQFARIYCLKKKYYEGCNVMVVRTKLLSFLQRVFAQNLR